MGELQCVHLNLVFEHSLLDMTSLRNTGGVLHKISIGQSWTKGGQSEADTDGRFVRMHDRVVMNVAVIRDANGLVVGLHVTVKYVDRLQSE